MGLASIDRLSDDVVVHILSFLPIEFSTTTSILARRWRFLWARVPHLKFDSDYLHLGKTSIVNIIDNVMNLHKGYKIDTFHLHLDSPHDCTDYELETWIATLIACNVRDLSLEPEVMLPPCLFTCKTLVDLCLYCCGNIPMTGAVHLPALKRLDLGMVDYESDESLPYLLSGCPVLEELTMGLIEDMICCFISSPTLNRIVLESENKQFEKEAYRMKLDTPALKYLKLNDSMFEDFSTEALTSLIEADVSVHHIFPTQGEVIYSCSVINFVVKLHNVKFLQLSTCQMSVPDSAFNELTVKFHNLTKLELAADFRFISFFLENADSLEVLVIRMLGDNLKYRMEPQHVPTCLSSHLRTVTINQFRCTEDGFELVRYILRNAKILKRMKINTRTYGTDLNKEHEALKRISKFERGSEACQVAFR